MKIKMLMGSLLVLLGAGGAYFYLKHSRAGQDKTPPKSLVAGMCAKLQIAEEDCPWCDPSLIEKKGE